jgi:dihydroflavonol-4-reductase
VRGTVRSLTRADELRARLGASRESLALFAADLMHDDGWADAVAGADYVLHIASPLPAKTPKSDDELIVPARDGALRALRHARDAGVKRLVMTSSTAAICYGMDGTREVFTEADWTNPDHSDTYPYVRSKVIAERAARDFIAREGGALEFCTINPGAVLGPVMGSDYSASVEIVLKLLSGAVPGCPRIGFPVVDVRDIADAHIRAMTMPGLNGERFLCAGEFLWMGQISKILREELGADARRAPMRQLPDFLVRVVALFDAEIRGVLTEIGKQRICDCSHARDVLGWTTRPARQTIADCGHSLVEHGIVRR